VGFSVQLHLPLISIGISQVILWSVLAGKVLSDLISQLMIVKVKHLFCDTRFCIMYVFLFPCTRQCFYIISG
jgi:hypothetical protein